MLRRREDPKTPGAERFEGTVVAEKGEKGAQVVEDVVIRAPLDDCRQRNHATSCRQEPDEESEIGSRSHEAYDQIDNDEEADEEGLSLQHVGTEGADPSRIRDVRKERREQDGDKRRVEGRAPE